MSNLDTLKKGYKDFAAGDMNAAMSSWSDDIVWEACNGLPYVTGTGVFKGKKAILEGIFSHVPEYFDNFEINIKDFIESGDKIVVVGTYSGKWKPTGKSFDAHATHVWTFKDGKAVHYFQATDTAAITGE